MAGKICLVTGATSGIGEATARELARRGATVVVAGRNHSRCEATVAAIRQEVGDSAGDYIVADLSTLQGVRGLAREFRARHDRLHVLVNNVGALFEYRQESADGIEMTLALNHLGPFLLTHLLLDTLPNQPLHLTAAAARFFEVQRLAREIPESGDRRESQCFANKRRSLRVGRVMTQCERTAETLRSFLMIAATRIAMH